MKKVDQHLPSTELEKPTGRPREKGATQLKGSLSERHIERLWERMTMMFGHRWISSYGAKDDGTWLAGLHEITEEQVKVAINKLKDNPIAWPPTLGEFRNMCLNKKDKKGLSHNTAAYEIVEPSKRLTKKADPGKARVHLETIKGVLK